MRLIFQTVLSLLRRWTWRYAWRDARSHWGSIFLYTGSIVIGVAALVAIRSFGANAKLAIEDQSKGLLGADLAVRSRQGFPDELKAFLDTIPGERSEQRASIGMAFLPKTKVTQLVQTRSTEPGFPWYGEVVTEPAGAYATLMRTGGGVLVEASMMRQMDMVVGDALQVDGITYEVVGSFKDMPGESSMVSQLAPRVLIPPPPKLNLALPFVPKLSANFRQISFKLDPTADLDAIVDRLQDLRKKHPFRYHTPESLSQRMGRRLGYLFDFLGLVGFVALLLGGIGVAGSINLYVRRKLPAVAMLRCIGGKAHETMAVYVLQALWMGTIGGLIGAAVGTGLQILLGQVFKDILPFTVGFDISWRTVAIGVGTGIVTTFLFALLPLLNVRRVPPLMALRADLEPSADRDPLRWVVYIAIAVAVTGFAVANSPKPIQGVIFSVGLLCAAVVLYGLARLLTAVLKWAPLGVLPFPARQGLKNLYRPKNQTTSLTLCLGLGVFLIMGQYLADVQLVRHVSSRGQGDQPNLVLFEVMDDQVEGAKEVLVDNGAQFGERYPVMKMRLRSVKGVDVTELMEKVTTDSGGRSRGGWVYRREYRVTCRDRLSDGEALVAGELPTAVEPGKPIPLTVEQEQARRLGVWVGDALTLTCGDKTVEARVVGIRQVDWFRLQPTFFLIFPPGALDDLPRFNVITANLADPSVLDTVKRQLVERYSNVWVVDLGTVVESFTAIFDRIAMTVRFMALFSMGTGILVLLTAVRNTRDHRLRENALLRTLGADGRTIFTIMGVEYAALGVLSAVVGNVLAVFASWVVAGVIFKLPYRVEWLAVGIAMSAVAVVTTVVGLANSRSVTVDTPLEALRSVD